MSKITKKLTTSARILKGVLTHWPSLFNAFKAYKFAQQARPVTMSIYRIGTILGVVPTKSRQLKNV